MSLIDPRAIIDLSTRLAASTQVGPWSTVGVGIEIGEGTVIGPYVAFKGPTKIDKHNRIYQSSSIGEDIPDLKYKGEPMRLIIGDHNVVCEGVVIRREAVQDRTETIIGNHNLIMAYAHIGHNSVINNRCVLVNNMALTGHVHVGDWAILSGYTLAYQYCWINAYSFFGIGSAIGKDVLAYVTVFDSLAETHNMSFEGMCRCGFSSEAICALRCACKAVYRQGHAVEKALAELTENVAQFFEIVVFRDSIQSTARGITR